MEITILAFGIAKDIVGGSQLVFSIEENTNVDALKKALVQQFPSFEKLRSLAIAINSEYADEDQIIRANDEIVLIPPVSGG